MQFVIDNFRLEKAEKQENDKVTRIKVISNNMSADKQNDVMLPEAFNKATVEYYLREGIIDWHHKSVLGKSYQERAAAILGKPVDFFWEDDKPVHTADLTNDHPINRESVLPHLNANLPVIGASVGGSILKAKAFLDPVTKKEGRKISEIEWNHTALAARPYVISAGSAVSLLKATTEAGESEVMLAFDGIGAFTKTYGLIKSYPDAEEFHKAVLAGTATDSAAMTDPGDVIRVQSLEGQPARLAGGDFENLVSRYLQSLKAGKIPATKEGLIEFFQGEGFSEYESETAGNLFLDWLGRAGL